MKIKKVQIAPDKEYDALRQEILKRLEMQNNHLNLMLTILTVLFSFGVSNTNIAFLIPPILCLLAFIWKGNNLMIIKLSTYIKNKFEGENFDLGWETYNEQTSAKLFSKNKTFLFAAGPFGIFIFSSIIAIGIGISKYNHTSLDLLLLIISIISFILIVFIFILYNSEKLRKISENN